MEKLHLVRVLVHQPVYQGSGTKLNAPYLQENATQKNRGDYIAHLIIPTIAYPILHSTFISFLRG